MIKPIVSSYTMILGIIIIRKALAAKKEKEKKQKNVGLLAIFGGFLDSIGGGGWGPIVTSTLLAGGRNARYTIGSVNLAEFFCGLLKFYNLYHIFGVESFSGYTGAGTGRDDSRTNCRKTIK